MGKKKGRWSPLGSHGLSGLPLAGFAAAARDGLYDLYLAAVLLDQVADVNDGVVAGVGGLQTLQGGIVSL
jgi:hypothetical protein